MKLRAQPSPFACLSHATTTRIKSLLLSGIRETVRFVPTSNCFEFLRNSCFLERNVSARTNPNETKPPATRCTNIREPRASNYVRRPIRRSINRDRYLRVPLRPRRVAFKSDDIALHGPDLCSSVMRLLRVMIRDRIFSTDRRSTRILSANRGEERRGGHVAGAGKSPGV